MFFVCCSWFLLFNGLYMLIAANQAIFWTLKFVILSLHLLVISSFLFEWEIFSIQCCLLFHNVKSNYKISDRILFVFVKFFCNVTVTFSVLIIRLHCMHSVRTWPIDVAWSVCLRLLDTLVSQTNKKLSYRRGTAWCIVSVEILPIATQHCRNYLYDNTHLSWRNQSYEVGGLQWADM